jgi:hypothetical protein
MMMMDDECETNKSRNVFLVWTTLFVNCFAFRKQVELEIIHLFPMEV